MSDALCAICILLGSLFSFFAALGMLRMPDLMMRMHAGTKAGTLAVSLMLLALMLHFMTMPVIIKGLIAIVFFFITIPVGAHMLGRAAYFIDIPLWDKTVVDELRDHYDADSHKLE
jgi:multicomponent Na+:H+ antiporter subunit G